MQLQRTVGNAATHEALQGPLLTPVGPASERKLMRASGEDPSKEVNRLQDEMLKLSKKGAWTGVARKYRDIEALGWELAKPDYHALAAQAEMRTVGVTEHYESLLRRGVDAGSQQAEAELNLLRDNYRRVAISPGGFLGGLFKGKPTLERAQMPFGPDHRRTVELAQTTLEDSKRFDGFLPFGEYTLNGEPVDVTAGQDVLKLKY